MTQSNRRSHLTPQLSPSVKQALASAPTASANDIPMGNLSLHDANGTRSQSGPRPPNPHPHPYPVRMSSANRVPNTQSSQGFMTGADPTSSISGSASRTSSTLPSPAASSPGGFNRQPQQQQQQQQPPPPQLRSSQQAVPQHPSRRPSDPQHGSAPRGLRKPGTTSSAQNSPIEPTQSRRNF